MSRDRLLDRYAAGLFTDKIEFRRISGDTLAVDVPGHPAHPDPYSSVVKGYFLLEDIDEQKKTEIYLHERSTLDSLTGLYNRITFIEKFNDILSRSSPGTRHALIMLDIDNFKAINDTLVTTPETRFWRVSPENWNSPFVPTTFAPPRRRRICHLPRNMNLGKPLETRVSDLCSLLSDEHTGVKVSASFGTPDFPKTASPSTNCTKSRYCVIQGKSLGTRRLCSLRPQLSFDDLSIPVRHL